MKKPAAALPSAPAPRQIMSSSQLDDVALAVIALTRELSILVDRVSVLEEVLDRHGIPATQEVDRLVPDAALESRLSAQRHRLIANITAALQGSVVEP